MLSFYKVRLKLESSANTNHTWHSINFLQKCCAQIRCFSGLSHDVRLSLTRRTHPEGMNYLYFRPDYSLGTQIHEHIHAQQGNPSSRTSRRPRWRDVWVKAACIFFPRFSLHLHAAVLCWEIPLSLACFDLFAPEKCIHCLAACVRAFDNECNRLLRRLRYNLLWDKEHDCIFIRWLYAQKSLALLCPTGKWIQSDSLELSHAFADAGFRNYFCHCVHWFSKWLSCFNFSLEEFRKGEKTKNWRVCALAKSLWFVKLKICCFWQDSSTLYWWCLCQYHFLWTFLCR